MQRPEDPGGILSPNHKGMIGFLRAKEIERGTAGGWPNMVKDGAFFTNSTFQQIQGWDVHLGS